MTIRTDPSALAWLVGNELRQARKRLGETQAAAAKVIDCSTSRMNYLENGRTVQRPDDVRALMRFYGAPDADGERLAMLVKEPGRRTWWTPWEPVIPDHIQLFVGLEGFATSEFVYLPLIIPGMLQTAGYAATMIDADQVSPLHHDRVIEFRQARQQRLLASEDPLRLAVVIEEDALDRPVGGADGMRAQLDHLLAMAERDNITVQVMPRSVAVHDGVNGAFTLLDFAATQSIGCVAYPDGAVYVPGYHQVAGYLYRRGRLQTGALGSAESREVIAARRAALD
ncbi:MAG: helix-turn-helix domain-containing protein [Pseudonocardia sp.]